MAITIADLILFNNVESTDLVQGAVALPYYKPLAYMANVTYSNGYQVYNAGNNGVGTQVLIRKYGKGNATHVKANTAGGAFRYNHQNTADELIAIPLDDVIKQSEEVFEAVELARISATGARKGEIVINNVIELSQELISAGLVAAAQTSPNVIPTTSTTILDDFLDAMALLDYRPTVAVVSQIQYTNLLKLVTSGEFIPAIKFDTIKTGLIGQFLGVDIYLDEDLDEQ